MRERTSCRGPTSKLRRGQLTAAWARLTVCSSLTRIPTSRFDGFQFGGDFSISAAVQNTAFALMSVQKFTFKNIDFSGNWGGLGNPFVGDWMVDGAFSDLSMPKVGICFDTGFLLRVSFRRIMAVGSDGARGSGVKCFSILHDVPDQPEAARTILV